MDKSAGLRYPEYLAGFIPEEPTRAPRLAPGPRRLTPRSTPCLNRAEP